MHMTEADAIAHATRHGLPLDAALTVPGLPRETPEGVLLAKIRQLARQYGWQTYHTHDSRKSEQGWPDLVLCDGRDLLIYELKDNTAKPTKEQATWLSLLAHTGKVECGIWRPRDYPAIVERLTRRTP